MIVTVSVPQDLPPGHSLRVTGKFTGGPGPFPAEKLTGQGEVSSNASAPAGAPGLLGFLRRPFLRHKFLQVHDDAGLLNSRFLKDPFLRPRPVRVMELDEVRGFGEYDLFVSTVDERGEESAGSSGLTLFLAPPPLSVSGQVLSGYDSEADVATFSFSHDSLRA